MTLLLWLIVIFNMEKVVIAKCVGCDNKREIKAGEVSDGEMPMCDVCFMPMVAESAKNKA